MISPIARLSHVALRTPDVGRARAHYQDVVGLTAYDEAGDTVFLASGGAGPALELRSGDRSALDHVAFEVAFHREEELLAALAAHDVDVAAATDPDPGVARAHAFADAEGNRIQACVLDGRPAAAVGRAGVVPDKIGHVATRTRDAAAVAAFYQDVLGFRWSDWVEDFFVFLRCNADHHSSNFLNAERPGELHHFAFEVRDAAHLVDSCDTLAAQGVPLLWGPGRHAPGHNLFTYHRDPDGNVVELFCDLDRMAGEDMGVWEPRPWHEQRPMGPRRWPHGEPLVANQWGPPAPDGDFLR